MTKRVFPHAPVLALALAAGFGLVACGGSHDAAAPAEAEGHGKATAHIAATDGDAARGEKLAKEKLGGRQACVECHGDKGNAPSADMAAPVLAGQYQDYLFHTMQAYREGVRDNALMTSHAKGLAESGKFDDQTIADLAAYFAAQPSGLRDLHGVK